MRVRQTSTGTEISGAKLFFPLLYPAETLV